VVRFKVEHQITGRRLSNDKRLTWQTAQKAEQTNYRLPELSHRILSTISQNVNLFWPSNTYIYTNFSVGPFMYCALNIFLNFKFFQNIPNFRLEKMELKTTLAKTNTGSFRSIYTTNYFPCRTPSYDTKWIDPISVIQCWRVSHDTKIICRVNTPFAQVYARTQTFFCDFHKSQEIGVFIKHPMLWSYFCKYQLSVFVPKTPIYSPNFLAKIIFES
jgi:hypothetical protein